MSANNMRGQSQSIIGVKENPFLPVTTIFFLNGVASLLGWNAVLNSLDYFAYVYEQNASLWFPVPLFMGYAIIAVLYNWLSYVRSYNFLISIGIIFTNISLTLMLLGSLVFENSKEFGFVFTLALCFIIGLGGNMAQLSFFAMINYLGEDTVSTYTIGSAVSGLSLTVIRMLNVSFMGSSEADVWPIVIFMVIAIIFNFFCLYMNRNFTSSQIYEDQIEKNLWRNRSKLQRQLLPDSSLREEPTEKPYARLMLETFQSIHPYPLYIAVNYVITFILFPALTVEKKMNMDAVWATLIFLLMYNLGDTAGKSIGGIRWVFNKYTVFYMFLARFFFFYTIPIMDSAVAQDDPLLNNNIFPFVNQFLFGMTNGFMTNTSFILSFEIVPEQYRKYAGILGGLSLQFGIMLGTFLAIPIEMWVDPVS